MVSFIVPAYNAEKTIKRTIMSILNQKDTNLEYEIVIINDGSNDGTDSIINKIIGEETTNEKNIVSNQAKIIYYTQENGGLSKARNVGLQKSKGDYIIFVDSDDYISEYLLRDIEEYINQNVDLIKWNPVYLNEEGKTVGKEECYPFDIKTGIEGFNYLYGKDRLISSAWNYAIKRYLVPEFPVGRYHEDFARMPIMMLKAKTMVSLNKNEYYYVLSNTSIMRGNDDSKKRKRLEDLLTNYDELIIEAKKLNLDKFTFDNFMIFLTNSMLVILPELQGENKTFFIKELRKRKIAKNIKSRNIKQFVKRILLEMQGF